MASELSGIISTLQKYSDILYKKVNEHKYKSGAALSTILLLSGRYVYCKLYRRYYSLPPGPEGIFPQFGNIISSGILIHPTWHFNIAMTYGPVSLYYLFGSPTIIINDASIAKQVLSNDSALARMSNETIKKGTFSLISAKDNTLSFLLLNGIQWTKIRQLMHSKLIRLLDTKKVNKIINQTISNKLEPQLINAINDNKLWYSRDILSDITFNVIFEANFNFAVDLDNNKECKQLKQDLVNVIGFDIAKRAVPIFILPHFISHYILRHLSFFKPVYKIRDRICDNIASILNQKRLLSQNVNDSFMDASAELLKNNEISSSQEIADAYLMFLAGTDTTSLTTEWGLVLLAKQPEIQKRVRNELISVLNKNNIDYSDNENIVYDLHLLLQLPLFRAMIHEILRISCVARLGAMHYLTDDIWIKTNDNKKYKLPKGSTLRYNINYIHYNNKKNGIENWKNLDINPERIYLENWLKESKLNNKYKFYQNASFLTFGFGKRDCIGKALAMKELRILFGYLLINYHFKLQPKYQNMKTIKCRGGVIAGVCKPTPEIPIIINKIS